MNKNKYIANIFRKILKEDLAEKAESIMNKLNYDEETHLYPDNEFDYVQESKSVCNECGGMMTEGECSECGYNEGTEIMELGGMDDGHPRFGNKNFAKMSAKEKEDLMSDRSYEGDFDDDEDDVEEFVDFKYMDEYPSEFESEEDEEGLDDLSIPDDMPSYKTKYRYRDQEDELTEKLHGKQHKLDKNKNGRLDKQDFKMLRKEDNEEQLYEVEFEKEVDESWYSHDEYERMRDFGTEDELEAYQDKLVSGGDEVEFEKEVEGGETEEGNAFTGMLKKTPKGHSFKLGGKEYKDRSSLDEKWKKEVDVKQTGEYSDMSIEELNAAIKKQKTKNDKTKEDGKKVSHADKTKMSQLYFAKRAKQGWKGKGKAKVTESILFTESDLIDLIERLVIEEKNSFKEKPPKGYVVYDKAHREDKKENENYLKSVAKKMTDYLKDMSSDKDSKYEMKETSKFPSENGGLKAKRKKYTPSEAVDEYIEAFSYPGQTNLTYDEIKPNNKHIEGQLKGSSTNGNAQVDKDGKALGNVVPSEVGERFYKNFKENLYGQEQQEASYKRQTQPVDQAGEDTESGGLKAKKGKKTAQGILNKLDESTEKKQNKLNEEFDRMQLLMGYSRKTQ